MVSLREINLRPHLPLKQALPEDPEEEEYRPWRKKPLSRLALLSPLKSVDDYLGRESGSFSLVSYGLLELREEEDDATSAFAPPKPGPDMQKVMDGSSSEETSMFTKNKRHREVRMGSGELDLNLQMPKRKSQRLV